MVTFSDKQLRILRHMLGIDDPYLREPKPWRDYCCAAFGNASLIELERLGAVERYNRSVDYDWYRTTAAGRQAAIASHASIRHPKAKRIYMRYLEVSDSLPDLTFREFLCSPMFRDTRETA